MKWEYRTASLPVEAAPTFGGLQTALLGLLIVFMSATRTFSDLPPPGVKISGQSLLFENIAYFQDYRFFIYPSDQPRVGSGHSAKEVSALDDLLWTSITLKSSKWPAIDEVGGLFLYAIPTNLLQESGLPAESMFTDMPEGVQRAALPETAKFSLRHGYGIRFGKDVSVILSIGGLPTRLTLIPVERYGPELSDPLGLEMGNPRSVLLLIAVTGVSLFGVAMLIRRNRTSHRNSV